MAFSRILAAALAALALSSCATAQPGPSTLPSDAEVVTYVTTNWNYYSGRFAWLSDRREASSTLLSVKDVECREDAGHAKCAFVAEARFEDGRILRQPMDSAFGRQADGSIEMLIQVVSR